MFKYAIGAIIFSTSIFSFAKNIDRTGSYYVSLSALTSSYQFDQNDARKELPSNAQEKLKGSQLSGSESDLVNINFGGGYYLSHDFAISLNYATGIELGFLDDLFRSNQIDLELDILSIEGIYHFYEVTPSLSTFALAGVSRFTIDGKVTKDDNKTSVSVNETNVHAGLGLNWDINESWAMKAGYNYYDFISINKLYANIEYHF